MVSTTGQAITGRQNITFAEDVTEEELKEMMERPDMQREALEALKALDASLINETLLSANHPHRDKVLRLLRLCPSMTTQSMASPHFYCDLGLWNGPHNWEEMQRSPRYFKGRPLLVKASVETRHDSPAYMEHKEGTSAAD